MNWFKKVEKLHPLQTLIYLMFVGICVLFIGFLVPFTISIKSANQVQLVKIPVTFYLSTFIIVLAGYFYKKGVTFYKIDDLKNHLKWLLVGFSTSLVFVGLQIQGWRLLASQRISIKSGITNPKVYLYILSGVHLIHLIGGLIFYILQLIKAKQAIHNPVKKILFVSDRIEELRLKLLGEYWQLLAILWLFVFVYFLVMFN